MIRHHWLTIAIALGLVGSVAHGAVVEPFEDPAWTTPANAVDAQIVPFLAKQGVKLRNQCSDCVFVRRVYLDAIGTMPTPQEVEAFLADTSPDKRSKLIDALLERDEFADYWSMKWCDILRVKSEFPINLWPNAVQAYHHWIRDQIQRNRPYDQFARELLTSSGSNFRIPAVNFYRAVQGRDPASLAKAAALTFMGARFEKWPKAKQDAMSAFFSKVAYKSTAEWKEEIVYQKPDAMNPIKTTFPDGAVANIPADADPRAAFAGWLISPNNKWFSRSVVNRIWAWTMGRGIIDEPDDIRQDNPPASPETLACLEKELVNSRYDLKHIYRLVFNSRTYQQSSIAAGDTANPKVAFAHYTIRQLDAEVLIDALCWLGGDGEKYSSPIPEPYTFIPSTNRTIALADASITSSFLTIFGRPSRDTGLMSERNNTPSETQRMYLLNSSDIQKRIEKSPRLQAVGNLLRGNRNALIRRVYLIILSRYPTKAEETSAKQYFNSGSLQPRQSAADLAWALINSKEFLCRH